MSLVVESEIICEKEGFLQSREMSSHRSGSEEKKRLKSKRGDQSEEETRSEW